MFMYRLYTLLNVCIYYTDLNSYTQYACESFLLDLYKTCVLFEFEEMHVFP
jgi:hypothetical protein